LRKSCMRAAAEVVEDDHIRAARRLHLRPHMPLPDDLLDPSAYDPRPQAVELRETHVSWVALTDRPAIKVKKPVNLGFLDFRQLEQRRAACEAEVRLNRRLAPDVYLGVAPLERGEEIVEWAVRMRRLPDADRGDVRLSRRALGPVEIDHVAERLAQF